MTQVTQAEKSVEKTYYLITSSHNNTYLCAAQFSLLSIHESSGTQQFEVYQCLLWCPPKKVIWKVVSKFTWEKTEPLSCESHKGKATATQQPKSCFSGKVKALKITNWKAIKNYNMKSLKASKWLLQWQKRGNKKKLLPG